MIFDEIKILRQHGKQFISDITKPQLPGPYKGRPEISAEKVNEQALSSLCPTGAIGSNPVSIDMGKCVMCGECSFAYPNKIKFTTDYKIAIEAHTDNKGTPDELQTLTTERANILMERLLSVGVTQDRIEAKGYVASLPIAPNTTNVNRAKNRRVQVILVPNF